MPKVSVQWLADDEVIFIEYDDMQVEDDESFDRWRDAVFEGLEKVREQIGGRAPLVVSVDGLHLLSCMGDRYSQELAMPVAKEFATIIARCGDERQTNRVVAVEAMRRTLKMDDPVARAREYAANIFVSRDEAVSFIRSLCAQGLIECGVVPLRSAS
ncbi:MAG: hypothetical protein AAGA54_01660 [Myxococcota bacterium]